MLGQCHLPAPATAAGSCDSRRTRFAFGFAVMSRRAARHQRGILQDVANQLAQIAVGWEVTFSGPALPAEPDAGIMEIDVPAASSTVNGRSTSLSIAGVLRSWILEEFARKDLSSDWLRSATVTIHYSRSGPPPNLTASAHVVSKWGEAVGHSSNSQALPTHLAGVAKTQEG